MDKDFWYLKYSEDQRKFVRQNRHLNHIRRKSGMFYSNKNFNKEIIQSVSIWLDAEIAVKYIRKYLEGEPGTVEAHLVEKEIAKTKKQSKLFNFINKAMFYKKRRTKNNDKNNREKDTSSVLT